MPLVWGLKSQQIVNLLIRSRPGEAAADLGLHYLNCRLLETFGHERVKSLLCHYWTSGFTPDRGDRNFNTVVGLRAFHKAL